MARVEREHAATVIRHVERGKASSVSECVMRLSDRGSRASRSEPPTRTLRFCRCSALRARKSCLSGWPGTVRIVTVTPRFASGGASGSAASIAAASLATASAAVPSSGASIVASGATARAHHEKDDTAHTVHRTPPSDEPPWGLGRLLCCVCARRTPIRFA
jgi:hypothetical protein